MVRPLARGAVAIALLASLASAGLATAKPAFKPKWGIYSGAFTKDDGGAPVHLEYAKYYFGGSKQKPGVYLYSWVAHMKCEDGSTRDAEVAIQAKRDGLKFHSTYWAPSEKTTQKLNGKWTGKSKLKGWTQVFARKSKGAPKNCSTRKLHFTAKWESY